MQLMWHGHCLSIGCYLELVTVKALLSCFVLDDQMFHFFSTSGCSELNLPLFENTCTIVGFADVMIVIGTE